MKNVLEVSDTIKLYLDDTKQVITAGNGRQTLYFK